jgi:hypothetical protein
LTEDLKTSANAIAAADARRVSALGRLDFFESALAFMAGYGIKSFLIAQSLNQIEKAYGANNSVLDNCHVRVAFATNDERTAKRVSDALGTATEMRDSTNYAGHRLSPWLGHLMVSRQETAGRCSPRRGDAASAGRRIAAGRGRAAGPGEEGALLRGCAVPRTHPAAAEAGRAKGLAKPRPMTGRRWRSRPHPRTKRRRARAA